MPQIQFNDRVVDVSVVSMQVSTTVKGVDISVVAEAKKTDSQKPREALYPRDVLSNPSVRGWRLPSHRL